MGTVSGRVLTDDQIEDAVIATLKLWFPQKLADIEAQLGLAVGYYTRPMHYDVHTDFTAFPEDQLPMVLAISVGTDDAPVKTGSRKYRAPYDIGVVTVASSLDAVSARRAAYRLGAAAKACLVHNQSLDLALGGTVRGVDWLGTRNDDIPSGDERTIRATRQLFRVEVDDVITRSAGPITPPPVDGGGDPIPDPDPTGDWPVITDRSKIRTTILPAGGS